MIENGYLIRLDFASPLHIGEPGVGMERSLSYVPSDTLFSALCNMWAMMYGKTSLESLLGQFKQGETPFRLSSAFPRLTIDSGSETEEVLYLPQPFSQRLRRLPDLSGDQETARQICDEAAKRAKEGTKTYVDWEFFGRMITSTTVGIEYYKGLDRASKLLGLVWRKSLSARSSLDRVTAQSNMFFSQRVRFGSREFNDMAGSFRVRGGLFLLLRADEPTAARLRSCFDLLGEQGVGGERRPGHHGRFTSSGWDEGRTLFYEPEQPNAFVVLSLYHPSPEERTRISGDGELIGYQLMKRGGWIDSPFIAKQQRKKSCFMFEEGSIFRSQPRGEIVDVTPEVSSLNHSIYRSGIAFAVGVCLDE